MQSPYFDDFNYDERQMMRERGDLVIGRHVIRTGIDLMNVAMDSAMESQRLTGERDALRVEVKEANARTAEEQVVRVQVESEIRRLKDRLERTSETLDVTRTEIVELRDKVRELATSYRHASAKTATSAAVASMLEGLLADDEEVGA